MTMPLEELDRSTSLDMAYSRRKAEQIVTSLEDPINQHLIKLLAFEGGPREHWLRELDAWFTRIGRIVWTRSNRPFDAAFYRRVLFDEPFGRVEERNVAGLIDLITRQYGHEVRRNDKDIPTIARDLGAFHARLADRFAQGSYEPSLLETVG